MNNAPRLYNSKPKLISNFSQMDNTLATIAFTELTYNEFKLFFLLQGTNEFTSKGKRFGIPEDFILDRTGMDSSALNKARKGLIKKGFIEYQRNKSYRILYGDISSRYLKPVEKQGIKPVENTGIIYINKLGDIEAKQQYSEEYILFDLLTNTFTTESYASIKDNVKYLNDKGFSHAAILDVFQTIKEKHISVPTMDMLCSLLLAELQNSDLPF